MQTNDPQTSQQESGSKGNSFTSGLNKETPPSAGNFQDAFRSLGSSIPLNRHTTADRQAMLANVANKAFARISEGGDATLNLKAENFTSPEFQGLYPVTAFLYETTVGKRHIYAYYVSLEIAGINLDVRRLNNGGFSNALEIPNTIADVVNDKSYQRELVNTIARRKGVAPEQVTLLQGYYFPKEASLSNADQEGHEDAQRVGQYLQRAYNCFYTLLNSSKNSLVELNLASLTSNIVIRHDVSELPGYDIAGNPYRSDIISRLSINSNERKESFAVTQENTNIVQAHAYIDSVFNTSEPIIARPGEAQRQAVIPHVIITKITSENYHDHRTLLLGLLAAFGIGDRQTRPWIGPLRLQPNGRSINTRDLGAFGLDRRTSLINPPTFVDTQNGNISDDDLRRLLSGVFVDNQIMYSIDVDELAEDAWLMQTLQAAAGSDAESNAICAWADDLTNGLFGQNYSVGRDGRVLFDWNIRLPAGSYIDSEGVKRDIRTFDYLGIMNSVVAPNENKYSGSEVGLLLSNIFTNENMNQVARYDEYRKLVQVPNFVQTGWFQRYAFNDKFVRAFIGAVIGSLAQTDEQGNGKAELINQAPSHGLEQRESFSSGMIGHASTTASWNNGSTGGFGGGFGGNTNLRNNSSFFTRGQ